MTRGVATACAAVLSAADPLAKVRAARAAARDRRAGRLRWDFADSLPDMPARGDRPPLLPPSHMPRRGRAGSAATRAAMLHALAHIEYVAIDLAFDCAGRFGARFGPAFVDDWIRIGGEEALHFLAVRRRLRALGVAYGDMPAHDGLWQAAGATAGDALARLAVVPMVLEARGLDVTPQMIARFVAAGDEASARVLRRIAGDEVGHVAAGVCWFHRAWADAQAQGRFDDPAETPAACWIALVRRHFRGRIKPPFNDSARHQAGLTPDYYRAIAEPAES